MRTNTKLTILFSAMLVIQFIFGFGFYWIRISEHGLFSEAHKSNTQKVIETVISYQGKGMLRPVMDNAAWDDMVSFINTQDTLWASEILNSVMATHDFNYFGVYNEHGEIIYTAYREMKSIVRRDPVRIKEIFGDSGTIRTYVNYNDTLLELFGATIVPTDDYDRKTGPKGYLLAGKIWDSAYYSELAGITGYNVGFEHPKTSNILSSPAGNNVRFPIINHEGYTLGQLVFEKDNPYLTKYDNLFIIGIIAVVVLIMVALIVFGLITKWISRPLKAIEESLTRQSDTPVSHLGSRQDEFGRIARLVISFRMQQEELKNQNLRHQEALEEIRKLSTAVDQSANSIIITDVHGKIEYVNKRFTLVTGYEAGEVTAKNPRILKSGLQEASFYHQMWKTILQGHEWSGEIANRDRFGNIFWESMTIAPIRNLEGSLVNFIAIKEDITARKNAELELQESREFAELIYKVIPSAIFTVDNDQKITSWNHQAEVITGFSTEEMIGQTCHKFAQTPCLHHCGLYDDSLPKPLKARECIIRTKDGQSLTVLKNVDALRDKHGNIIGGIESFEDITDRKQTELDLLRAKEAAEIASKAKSEFLATMSHEIRTPMNGVIGMTELALTTKLTPSQRDYLQSIQTSAYLLLDTINDILDFSKIEAGRLEIEKVEFNIYEVVERSVEILTVKAYEKKIELLCEIEPGMPGCFRGDPLRIRQILVNLISNAVKFTNQGEICVSARLITSEETTQTHSLIRFSVRDTGIGIDEISRKNIFDRFTQADSSTTRKYGGTGLGLSISKKLTEMMGGTLDVESIPGEGSTFSFTIPLERIPCQGLDASLPNRDIKKVLVVDDNLTNLKIMTEMLKYWNIEAETCTSGNEAFLILEKASDNKQEFDLIILDMHMPDMDGVEVADTIKNRMLFSENPILFLHSSVDKDHILQSRKELGVDHFLTKPVKMKDMYELLTQGKSRPTEIAEATVIPDDLKLDKEKTILIAEDNVINMKLLYSMLIKTGARVIRAENGNEAVERFLSEKVDLIFMDVHMPMKDGFQATREIRQHEKEGIHTPIIALTAIAMPGDREKCLESGMDDYLSKPFKKDDLFAVLSGYLSTDTSAKV